MYVGEEIVCVGEKMFNGTWFFYNLWSGHGRKGAQERESSPLLLFSFQLTVFDSEISSYWIYI